MSQFGGRGALLVLAHTGVGFTAIHEKRNNSAKRHLDVYPCLVNTFYLMINRRQLTKTLSDNEANFVRGKSKMIEIINKLLNIV